MRLIPIPFLLLIVAGSSRGDELDDRLAKELADVVRDGRTSVWARIEAAKTLGKLGPTMGAAVPELSKLLVKFRPNELSSLQEEIIRALGLMGNPAKMALPAMARAGGQNVDIDRALKVAIGQITQASDQYDLVALVAQLGSKDETIRLRAVKAIARLGPLAKPALEELLRSMSDPDPDVRRAAVAAVRLVAPNEKPTEAMMRVYALDLQDPDDTVRLRAATILGRLGPAAVSAVPALEAALSDSDRDVKRAVTEALNKISPP